MRNRFKYSLFYSFIYFILIIILNAASYIIIQFIPFILHGEYSFFESQGSIFLFYFPIILMFSLVFGQKKIHFIYPIFYLVFSLFIMIPSSMEAWDAMYFFNFEFSKFSFIIYELLENSGFLENNIFNIIMFNTIFFIYQVGVLICTKIIFEKFKYLLKIR